jgi:hypothetical protein
LDVLDIAKGAVVALGMTNGFGSLRPDDLEYGLDDPRIVSQESSARVLVDLLTWMQQKSGPLSLIVENDLARPTDPAIVRRTDVFVVEETVYHHRAVADIVTPTDAIEYLGTSASGYPLNAFVIKTLTAAELRQTIVSGYIAHVYSHLQTIINSVFDCEGYCAWLRIPDFDSLS